MSQGNTQGDITYNFFLENLNNGFEAHSLAAIGVDYLEENNGYVRDPVFDDVAVAMTNKATVAKALVDSGVAFTDLSVLDVVSSVTSDESTVTTALSGISSAGTVTNIMGTTGDDILDGTSGADIIRGGTGTDTMNGHEGDDVFIVVGDLTGGGKVDTEADTKALGFNISSLNFTNPNEDNNGAAETINGGAGNDTLYVIGTADISNYNITGVENIEIRSNVTVNEEVFSSLSTVQTINGDGSSTLKISGGSATQPLNVDLSQLDSVTLENIGHIEVDDNVMLTIKSLDDLGGAKILTGNGTIKGSNGTDITLSESYTVQNGLNIIQSNGSAAVGNAQTLTSVINGTGTGTINGTDGDDYLVGTAANDIFVTGKGNDVLTGKEGSDKFIVNGTGKKIILDSDEENASSGDTLDLSLAGSQTINSQILVEVAYEGYPTGIDENNPVKDLFIEINFTGTKEDGTIGTFSSGILRTNDSNNSYSDTYVGLKSLLEESLDAAGFGNLSVEIGDAITTITTAAGEKNLAGTANQIKLTDPEGNEFSNVSSGAGQSASSSSSDVASNIIAVAPNTTSTKGATIDLSSGGNVGNDTIIELGAKNAEGATSEGSAKNNVMIILDSSGSMYGSNMSDAKAAAITLLNAYDSLGDVSVRLVDFDSYASSTFNSTNAWMSVSDAKSFITNDFYASGGTNYDNAIDTAMDAFGTNQSSNFLAGGTNASYFLSDGEPSYSGKIDSAKQIVWENFLIEQQITSHALGFDGIYNTKELEPIAFDGTLLSDINQDHDLGQIDPTIEVDTSNLGDALLKAAGLDFLENLIGTNYDDEITVNSLNNIIDGKSGTDTVIFTGSQDQYTITNNGNSLTVVDTVADRDGIGSLTDIEVLSFNGVLVETDTLL